MRPRISWAATLIMNISLSIMVLAPIPPTSTIRFLINHNPWIDSTSPAQHLICFLQTKKKVKVLLERGWLALTWNFLILKDLLLIKTYWKLWSSWKMNAHLLYANSIRIIKGSCREWWVSVSMVWLFWVEPKTLMLRPWVRANLCYMFESKILLKLHIQ